MPDVLERRTVDTCQFDACHQLPINGGDGEEVLAIGVYCEVVFEETPVMLIPSTWMSALPFVASLILKTARVKVWSLAKSKVSWVNATLPVPPDTVACPLGLALRSPLPLSEVKLTSRLLGPTVPVTVVTFVAGLSNTLSVP